MFMPLSAIRVAAPGPGEQAVGVALGIDVEAGQTDELIVVELKPGMFTVANVSPCHGKGGDG